MRWSEEPAHCQTMAAEDRLLNTSFLFCVKFLDYCVLFLFAFSHAHSKRFASCLRHSGGVQYSGGEDSWSWYECCSGGDGPRAVHRWRYRSCVRAEERAGRRDGGVLLRAEGELARGQEVAAEPSRTPDASRWLIFSLMHTSYIGFGVDCILL